MRKKSERVQKKREREREKERKRERKRERERDRDRDREKGMQEMEEGGERSMSRLVLSINDKERIRGQHMK